METNADLTDLLYELLESVLTSRNLVNKTVYSVMARLGIKRPKLENFAAKSAAQSA
jgi:hypothetical protein